MGTDIGPHEYHSNRKHWWQVWRKDFCLGCYEPFWAHPTICWRQARPIGDTRDYRELLT